MKVKIIFNANYNSRYWLTPTIKRLKKMKRRFILTSMFLSAVILVYGQRSIPTDYKGGNSIGLQMDAFDFMAKGFSIWCNYTSNYNRIFLDVGRNELPDFLNPLSDGLC